MSEDQASPAVFFSRCRPQNSDPIDIVVQERRLFIGWAAWRDGVEPSRGHLRDSVVDLWCSNAEWASLYTSFGPERRHYQQNRNFIRTIKPGASPHASSHGPQTRPRRLSVCAVMRLAAAALGADLRFLYKRC